MEMPDFHTNVDTLCIQSNVILKLFDDRLEARSKGLVLYYVQNWMVISASDTALRRIDEMCDCRVLIGTQRRKPNGNWSVISRNKPVDCKYFFKEGSHPKPLKLIVADKAASVELRCSRSMFSPNVDLRASTRSRILSLSLAFEKLSVHLRDHACFEALGSLPCVAENGLDVKTEKSSSATGLAAVRNLKVASSACSEVVVHTHPGCVVHRRHDDSAKIEILQIPKEFLWTEGEEAEEERRQPPVRTDGAGPTRQEGVPRWQPRQRRFRALPYERDRPESSRESANESLSTSETALRAAERLLSHEFREDRVGPLLFPPQQQQQHGATPVDWEGYEATRHEPLRSRGTSSSTRSRSTSIISSSNSSTTMVASAQTRADEFFVPHLDPKETDAPEGMADELLCVTCMSREKRCFVSPCGHKILCVRCSRVYLHRPVRERICPICRDTMRGITKVFE